VGIVPFLERLMEWRECAADGKRLPLWRVIGVPCTRAQKENATRAASRYLCVAHSWKVFSGMLLEMPRSGVAACAATVAYPLARWSYFRTYVANFSSPLGIKCADHSPLGYSVGCFDPTLRGTKEGDLIGLVPVARTTLFIDHNGSGIRLDLSAPRSTRRDG
jgi:hypothetical protein